MENLSSDLLNELECPVCFELMIPPITLCINGHSICETCKSKLETCSICRGRILDVRNRTAETLARNVKYPCKFQKAGCSQELLLDAKNEHDKTCSYAPHKCPFQIVGNCYWEGPLPNVAKHIRSIHNGSSHDVTGGQQSSRLLSFANGVGWHQAMFTLDEVFFRYSKIINNNLFICCMYVGSSVNATKYKYEVTIKSMDGIEKESVCRICPSYKQFMEEKFTNVSSAEFSSAFAKKCTDKEGHLTYVFEISRV